MHPPLPEFLRRAQALKPGLPDVITISPDEWETARGDPNRLVAVAVHEDPARRDDELWLMRGDSTAFFVPLAKLAAVAEKRVDGAQFDWRPEALVPELFHAGRVLRIGGLSFEASRVLAIHARHLDSKIPEPGSYYKPEKGLETPPPAAVWSFPEKDPEADAERAEEYTKGALFRALTGETLSPPEWNELKRALDGVTRALEKPQPRITHDVTCPTCRRFFCSVSCAPGSDIVVHCPGCIAEGRV